MIDQQINEQLGLLQKELSRLKTVTDYIDGAKEISINTIAELEKVQQNYAVYTDKIFNLYKQSVDDLKKNTEIQINDGVSKFEITGNKIDTTNREKLVEIKRLLEQYKNIVEATDSLVKTLKAVDFPARLSIIDESIQVVDSTLKAVNFPARLSTIDKNIQVVDSTLKTAIQSIGDNQAILIQRLEQQVKKFRLLEAVLFVICGLIAIGTIATIFVLK
ncbi:MAG: hypothetical protein JG782_1229 [Anaerophaga sp.]|uniref:hypothetical protein n=1 Tax=Anaerophaga thermohalophila TaxID=177400 RepID=UPI000237D392|nr:hypothetical protein [Anaerophaga thermohalophila]MBZ4676609.1 hypothetical protein [Anaerophaga sp.]MDI3521795.1 hypothetical protein [Anaerophaga sp.]MDK2841474.1 hypothetical protein [Anaerophaga sp.]MDN5290263.1 hypothetical protein [Anaerophaga sp.]